MACNVNIPDTKDKGLSCENSTASSSKDRSIHQAEERHFFPIFDCFTEFTA